MSEKRHKLQDEESMYTALQIEHDSRTYLSNESRQMSQTEIYSIFTAPNPTDVILLISRERGPFVELQRKFMSNADNALALINEHSNIIQNVAEGIKLSNIDTRKKAEIIKELKEILAGLEKYRELVTFEKQKVMLIPPSITSHDETRIEEYENSLNNITDEEASRYVGFSSRYSNRKDIS